MRLLILILIPAAVTGFLLARFIPGRLAAWLSAILPVVGLTALVIYDVFITPYNESGSNEWMVALFIGGLVAGYCGYFFYWLGNKIFASKR